MLFLINVSLVLLVIQAALELLVFCVSFRCCFEITPNFIGALRNAQVIELCLILTNVLLMIFKIETSLVL